MEETQEQSQQPENQANLEILRKRGRPKGSKTIKHHKHKKTKQKVKGLEPILPEKSKEEALSEIREEKLETNCEEIKEASLENPIVA